MKLIDRLAFSLPVFQRITWVSELLRQEWEKKLSHLADAIDDVFTSEEIVEFVPIQIKLISNHDLYLFKKRVFLKGLYAEQIENLTPALRFAYGVGVSPNSSIVVLGSRQQVVECVQQIDDLIRVDLVAKLPAPIIPFWADHVSEKFSGSLWAYLDDVSDSSSVSEIYNPEGFVLNPYWTRLGISALPYCPSRLDCIESLEVAFQIRKIFKDKFGEQLSSVYYQILSWPLEWSALHGIAEIKTPLFKLIYNTDASGKKYSMRLRSNIYPDNGVNGLLFPYKPPKKLFTSESEKFKRGVRHLIDTLN